MNDALEDMKEFIEAHEALALRPPWVGDALERERRQSASAAEPGIVRLPRAQLLQWAENLEHAAVDGDEQGAAITIADIRKAAELAP
jgi:hypothetical protein